MIMTVLEAEVKPENHSKLSELFKEEVGQLPPELGKTYLVQSTENKNLWRIMTVWRNKEDLEDVKKLGNLKAAKVFRQVGTEALLSNYSIENESG